MGIKFANFAEAKLATPPTGTSGLTFTVAAGKGALFPTLGAGDYVYAVFVNSARSAYEVVKVTARSGDAMTIDPAGRGIDGTTAQTWTASDFVYTGIPRLALDLLFTIGAGNPVLDELASTTAGKGASRVGIQDAAGYFVATTVEAALAELQRTLRLKVFVPIYATGGSGTFADPWTGWDTIAWAANTQYDFPDGWYAFTNTLNIHKAGIRLQGSSYRGTVLWHQGTGRAIVNDTGDTSTFTPDSFSFSMSDMRIWGNVNTTDGLYIRGHSLFSLVRCGANNLSGAALRTGFTVQAYIEQWKCTANEGFASPARTVSPDYGMYLDGNVLFGGSMSYTIVDPAITSCNLWGIYGNMLQNSKIIGGASENNVLGSLFLGPNSGAVTLDKFYANNTIDLSGSDHTIMDATGGGPVIIRGFHCHIERGIFTSIQVAATARATRIYKPTVDFGGLGLYDITDSAPDTSIVDKVFWSSSTPTRGTSQIRGTQNFIANVDVKGVLTVHPNSVGTAKLRVDEIPFDGTWMGANLNGLAMSFGNCNLASSSGASKPFYLNRPTGEAMRFTENFGTPQIEIAAGGIVTFDKQINLKAYTVGTLPSAAAASGLIMVSDEAGGPVPAFSETTNWRRVTDRAIVA